MVKFASLCKWFCFHCSQWPGKFGYLMLYHVFPSVSLGYEERGHLGFNVLLIPLLNW